jgi:hypothetical protein
MCIEYYLLNKLLYENMVFMSYLEFIWDCMGTFNEDVDLDMGCEILFCTGFLKNFSVFGRFSKYEFLWLFISFKFSKFLSKTALRKVH